LEKSSSVLLESLEDLFGHTSAIILRALIISSHCIGEPLVIHGESYIVFSLLGNVDSVGIHFFFIRIVFIGGISLFTSVNLSLQYPSDFWKTK
jgi:hypothetical protein